MSQHWRTSRIASGGQQRPGSPHAHDTQRDLPPLPRGSVISRDSFLEGREFGQSSFDERELAANCLFFGLLAATALAVFVVYVGYQALIF